MQPKSGLFVKWKLLKVVFGVSALALLVGGVFGLSLPNGFYSGQIVTAAATEEPGLIGLGVAQDVYERVAHPKRHNWKKNLESNRVTPRVSAVGNGRFNVSISNQKAEVGFSDITPNWSRTPNITFEDEYRGVNDFTWVDARGFNSSDYGATVKLPQVYSEVFRCEGEKDSPECFTVQRFEEGMEKPYYKVRNGSTFVSMHSFSGAGGGRILYNSSDDWDNGTPTGFSDPQYNVNDDSVFEEDLVLHNSPRSLPSGLVFYYTLGDWGSFLDGETIPDASSNNYDGTLDTPMTVTSVDGPLGSEGKEFDNGDQVDSSYSGNINGEITVSFWANFKEYISDAKAISKPYDGSSTAWEFKTVGTTDQDSDGTNELSFGSYDGSEHRAYVDQEDVPLNTWHHVVGTYNGSGWQIYIDGEDATDGTIGSQGTGAVDSSGAVTFPGQGDGSYVAADLDEVMLFDRHLTDSEISELYFNGEDGVFEGEWTDTIGNTGGVEGVEKVSTETEFDQGAYDKTTTDNPLYPDKLMLGYRNGTAGDSLVGYWRMDETSGGSVKDYSGNNRDGTNNGATRGSTGVLSSNAFDFDDANTEHVEWSDGTFQSTSEFTVSLWFKMPSTSSEMMLWYSGSNFGGETELAYRPSSDNIRMIVVNAGCGVSQAYSADSVNPDNGQWHHAVARWDGSNIDVWLDGTNGADTSCGSINGQNDPTSLGTRGRDDSFPLDGKIDEVRMYDTALSGSEIQDLYYDVDFVSEGGYEFQVDTSNQQNWSDLQLDIQQVDLLDSSINVDATPVYSDGSTGSSYRVGEFGSTGKTNGSLANIPDSENLNITVDMNIKDRIEYVSVLNSFTVFANNSGDVRNWNTVEIDADVPSDTDVKLNFDTEGGDSNTVLDVKDGVNNYTVGSNNSQTAEIRFEALSRDLFKTPKINSTEVYYNDKGCSPPDSGDWILNKDCTIYSPVDTPANVEISSSTLNIVNNASLNLDFQNNHLLVDSSSSILLESGSIKPGLTTPWSYGFEDGNDDGWNAYDSISVTTSTPYAGTYNYELNTDSPPAVISTITPDPWQSGFSGGTTNFTYYYREDLLSNGGGIHFNNTNGERELAIYSDNPQIEVYDSSGTSEVFDPATRSNWYDSWIKVNGSIDFSDDSYSFEVTNTDTGSDYSHSGTLASGTDVRNLSIVAYNSGWTGGNSFDFHFDSFEVGTSK